MSTKYFFGVIIGAIFLVSCNENSSSEKESIIKKKSMNVNFEYQRQYTQTGEKNVIEIHVSPKKTKFKELDKLSKKIDVDSCKIIDKSVIKLGDNRILDVGDIKVNAQWYETPLTTLKYSHATKNYNAFVIYGLDKRLINYRSGDKVTFQATNPKITISGNAITPIEIISPKINSTSHNVDTTMPLKVTWSGGSSQNILIYLTGIWTSLVTEEPQTLACNVENDGNFIIPIDILNRFEWRQKTELSIIDRQTVLSENAELIMGAYTQLTIYINKSARPSAPTHTMQEGYVENKCSTKEECGGGECLNDKIFADGYCSIKHCQTDNQCPNDAHCFIEKGQFSLPQFCAKPCSVDSDCRTPYYHCREDDNHIKSCVPAVF